MRLLRLGPHPQARGAPLIGEGRGYSLRGFRRLVKWRTGWEGRISYLKRRYGFDRTLFDGLEGARTWCALAVLANNTVKIAALIEAKRDDAPVPPALTRRGKPATAARDRTTGHP